MHAFNYLYLPIHLFDLAGYFVGIPQGLSLIILSHFEFEGEFMEQACYPFLKAHKRLHDHFLQRFIAYTHRFDSGEDVTKELVPFLSSWLQNHFRQEDKDYSPSILAEIQGGSDKPSKGRLSRTLYKFK